MSYSDFSLKRAAREFQLTVVEKRGLFAHLNTVQPSEILTTILEENIPLAVSINTEKARSELIVANVLVELRKLFARRISFFSGIELDVNQERSLSGRCDFLVSLSPEQMFLSAPVITIVEAKNDNLISGLGQCVAEMVAAQTFNEREGNSIPLIYGAVTSGNVWLFLKLENATVSIDLQDYLIDDLPQLLGILSAMVNQAA